jgi:hypothetical protein
MKREIIAVNNFYENPEEVVRYAMSLKYYNPWIYNQKGSSVPEDMIRAVTRVSFFRKAKDCPFKSSKKFISTLEQIVGEEIDLDHWNKDFPENPIDGTLITPRPDLIDPTKPESFDNLAPDSTSCRWNCIFQVKHLKHEPGTEIHNHTRDIWNSVGLDGWTGLIYLNEDAPRDSGLKTWKNKYNNNFEYRTSADRWELIDDFANVYNRLILIRGDMPHVGGSGWGDNLNNGRLFQTLFFKTKKINSIDSFTLSQ